MMLPPSMGLSGRLSVVFSHTIPIGVRRGFTDEVNIVILGDFSPDDGLIDANKHRLETIHPLSAAVPHLYIID